MPVYVRYGQTNFGTPMMLYDLEMLLALGGGMTEDTRAKQLAKSLAYWQGIQTTTHDANLLIRANDAVNWMTTELARIQNPPPDTGWPKVVPV